MAYLEILDYMGVIVFAVMIGSFAFIIIKDVFRWNKDNKSPILTEQAQIVEKRIKAYDEHSDNYFVTFQLEEDSIELEVAENQYGLLRKNDKGLLTFQGMRFVAFE